MSETTYLRIADSTGVVWQHYVDDNGILYTDPSTEPSDPVVILKSYTGGDAAFQLTTATNGQITSDQVGFAWGYPSDYTLISSGNVAFYLKIKYTGQLVVSAYAADTPTLETLKDLRDRLRTRLQDPDAEIWTDAELNQYINLGLVDLQQETQWMEDWYEQDVSASLADYPRNVDIIQNMRYQVWDTYRIDSLPIYKLDQYKPDWKQDGNAQAARVYRKDWSMDALYPPPDSDGDSFTFNQEYGVIVALQDASSNYISTFDQEQGTILMAYDTIKDDDWFMHRIVVADPRTDSYGVPLHIGSPYGNLISVFSRYPDVLVNDDDIVPFQVFAHYAIEEFVLSMAFLKEGEGFNVVLAKAHRRMYDDLWLPFVKRVINNRTPDHPWVMHPLTPGDPRASNRSQITPNYASDGLY